MGSTNVGNQSVYFNYHKVLTGDNFNRAQQNLQRPGALTSISVTKYSNTVVTIGTGVFAISDGSRLVTINKASANNLTVSNSYAYVVIRYSYETLEDNYADFLAVTNPSVNDVVLAKLNWSGSTLSSVDLSYQTNANIIYDYDLFITANSVNQYFKDAIQAGIFGNSASGNNWLDKISDSWFDDTNDTPIEENIGVLPVYTFDKTANRYFYFYLKSGSPVDIKFRIKYTGSSSSSGVAKFNLDYVVLTDGLTSIDSITFDDTTTGTINTPGGINTYREIITDTLKIPSAASAVANKLILCRVYRDYEDTDDTYSGDISLIEMIPTAA